MKVAILGAHGLLGSELYNHFKNRYNIYGITKLNYEINRGEEFDLFINANGNSRKFWANNNGVADFNASTTSVYNTFFDFSIQKYIYISSADVYDKCFEIGYTSEKTIINPSRLSIYGFNKYLAELVVQKFSQNYVILRCSALIGSGLKKGLIKDIIDGTPLFLSADSTLQFITTAEIGKIIETIVTKGISNQIINVGGIGAVSPIQISEILNKGVIIRNDAEKQRYEMNVEKILRFFPVQKTMEYVKAFIHEYKEENVQ
ncbi:MAG TPA: NAD-dependent epimerase/dehydratase family protein [Candidatus Brocadiaceae bacterium]|nr:MAG: hypothetical protein A2Y09_05340 [Planctomycetes bacterium GWA2_39_15]